MSLFNVAEVKSHRFTVDEVNDQGATHRRLGNILVGEWLDAVG